MSSFSAWEMRSLRASFGNMPASRASRTPSRNIMIVGMDWICRAAESSWLASVSTLPKVTSGCSSEVAS